MEGSQKRKRDADLPRITYNAGHRTFDRLFKEDTLDGLLDVVRKKLGVSASTPIHLAQLRDGNMVDLEDDDDFEAFASSVYNTSTATVRIAVGNEMETNANTSQIPKEVSEDEPPKKKKKKEGRKKHNDAAEPSDMSEHTNVLATGDSSTRQNKRRVSFHEVAVPQPSVAQSPVATSFQEVESLHQKDLDTSNTQAVQLSEGEELTAEEEHKKNKKEKREKKEKGRARQKALSTELSSKDDTSVEQEPEKKKKTKRVTEDNDEPQLAPQAADVLTEKSARSGKARNGDTLNDHAPQKKTSKKVRDIEPDNDGTSGAEGTTSQKLSTAQEMALKSKDTKKQKKTHNGSEPTAEQTGSEEQNDSVANTVVTQTVDIEPTQLDTSSKSVAEVKTSKKTTNKKIRSAESSGNMESVKQVVQALLARKAAPQPPPSTQVAAKPVTASRPPPDAVKSAKEASSSSVGTQAAAVVETESISAAPLSRRGKATTTSSSKVQLSKATKDSSTTCPICEEGGHIRSKCPIVKKGIKAMQKRIVELERDDTPEEVPGARAELVAEMRTLIEGKRRKSKATLATAATTETHEDEGDDPASAVKSVADAFASSTTVNVVSPLLAGTSNDAQISPQKQTRPQPKLSAKAILSSHSASTSIQSAPYTKSVPLSRPPPSTQPLPHSQSSSYSEEAPLSIEASPSTRPPPSTQPPPLTQPLPAKHPFHLNHSPLSVPSKKLSQKTKAVRPSDAALIPTSFDLSLANGSFSALGDISAYTDHDIEELMRGPKLTSKDVPSEDEEMSVDDEEPVALEEDEVVIRGPRKSSQRDYPSSSSDEGDEEDDDVSPEQTDSAEDRVLITSMQVPSAGGSDDEPAEKSFYDLDAMNTSRFSSVGNAGDIAALVAIHADVGTPTPTPPTSSQPAPGKANGDTQNTDSQQDDMPVPAVTQLAEDSDVENTDPIENVDAPPSPPAESIASDDDSVVPKQSTPKKAVTRTRSQRNKPVHEVLQSQPEPEVEDAAPKAGRQTRSRRKISELPIPPVPSERPTRARATAVPPPVAPTPRTTRLRTRASSQALEEEPTEIAPAKTASKTPARSTKTPLKPASKAAGKLTLQSKTPVKPLSKLASKPPAASKPSGTRNTRAMRLAADLESAEEDAEMEESRSAPEEAEQSLATWDVLPNTQSNLSQLESENAMMVDELISSPATSGKASSTQQTPSQAPLFIYSETQQSFPYSQYPVESERPATPASDSDDAMEVAAAITKGPRVSSTFRGLSQIARESRIFARYSLPPASASQQEPLDLFGTNGKDDDEEEEEETEASESDDDKAPSHIPDGRIAGAKVKGRR